MPARRIWSRRNGGIDLTPVGEGRKPTRNRWVVGWSPNHKSFAAYRYNRVEGHRAWLFHSVEDAKWFCSFLKEHDWVNA